MTQCEKIVCADMCKCLWDSGVDKQLAFGIVTPRRTYHVCHEAPLARG